MNDIQRPSKELIREAVACAKHLDEEGMGYSADVMRRTVAEIERLRGNPLCPHGMPLADNICGPCSEGRPNRAGHEPPEGYRAEHIDAAWAELPADLQGDRCDKPHKLYLAVRELAARAAQPPAPALGTFWASLDANGALRRYDGGEPVIYHRKGEFAEEAAARDGGRLARVDVYLTLTKEGGQ